MHLAFNLILTNFAIHALEPARRIRGKRLDMITLHMVRQAKGYDEKYGWGLTLNAATARQL